MTEIDVLVAEINKKYKTNVIRKASELKSIEFIPYSSPKMNYLTRGGIPVGRMIEYVGLPQSGKTTTALDALANYQKKYKGLSVYLDAENTLEKEWGEKLGVNWKNVILIQPEGGDYGEELLDMVLDYIRSGKIGFTILDSAPFIVPRGNKKEANESLQDKNYGGNSALMKAFCDKVIPLCKQHESTFLMLNQLRENIGNMYQPYKIPCGTAITHASSEILWFTKGSLLDEKGAEVSGNYPNPCGNMVNVKMYKNKVTKNDRRLDSYTLNYDFGIDTGADTIDLAVMLGLITQNGAWFRFEDSKGKEVKVQGRNGLTEWFYNDLVEFEKFKKKLYKEG